MARGKTTRNQSTEEVVPPPGLIQIVTQRQALYSYQGESGQRFYNCHRSDTHINQYAIVLIDVGAIVSFISVTFVKK